MSMLSFLRIQKIATLAFFGALVALFFGLISNIILPTTYAESSSQGTYTGYMGLSGSPFITKNNISKDDALALCRDDRKKHTGKLIRCVWKDNRNITVAPPKNEYKVELGVFKSYFDNSKKVANTFKSISREETLKSCTTAQKNNPARAIRCTWNDTEVFLYNPPVIKLGQLIANNKLDLLLNTTSVVAGDSVTLSYDVGTNYATCTARISYGSGYKLLDDKNNILFGRINWKFPIFGKREFKISKENIRPGYQSAKIILTCYNTVTKKETTKEFIVNIIVPISRIFGTYRAYFDGSTRPFVTTIIIKKEAALNNCKVSSSANPNKAIRCTWNGEEIYTYSPTVNTETAQEVVTCNFSGSLAIETCSTSILNTQYTCSGIESCTTSISGPKGQSLTWSSSLSGTGYTTLDNQDESLTFIKAYVPPATGIYRGYLNGSNTPFITTSNITEEDALTSCMDSQANNSALSIRCTWNGTEIYTFSPPEPISTLITCVFSGSTTGNSTCTADIANWINPISSCTGANSCTMTLTGLEGSKVVLSTNWGERQFMALTGGNQIITFTVPETF